MGKANKLIITTLSKRFHILDDKKNENIKLDIHVNKLVARILTLM